MTPRGVGSIWHALTRQVLGKEWWPHSARHSKCYNLLVVQKKNPLAVRDYMAHANIQTTMSYIDTGMEVQRAAFEDPSMPTAVMTTRSETPNESEGSLVKAYLTLFKADKITKEQFIKETEGLL